MRRNFEMNARRLVSVASPSYNAVACCFDSAMREFNVDTVSLCCSFFDFELRRRASGPLTTTRGIKGSSPLAESCADGDCFGGIGSWASLLCVGTICLGVCLYLDGASSACVKVLRNHTPNAASSENIAQNKSATPNTDESQPRTPGLRHTEKKDA